MFEGIVTLEPRITVRKASSKRLWLSVTRRVPFSWKKWIGTIPIMKERF